jgi:hypothetical protein
MNYLECRDCKVKIPIGKESKGDGHALCFKCMLVYIKKNEMNPDYDKIFKDLIKAGIVKPKSELKKNEQ